VAFCANFGKRGAAVRVSEQNSDSVHNVQQILRNFSRVYPLLDSQKRTWARNYARLSRIYWHLIRGKWIFTFGASREWHHSERPQWRSK
jgi:hypothetical protein